jgi:hypothetical protein
VHDIREQIIILGNSAKKQKVDIKLSFFLNELFNLLMIAISELFRHPEGIDTSQGINFFRNIEKHHRSDRFLALYINDRN